MNRKLEILEINSILYFIIRASYIGICITNLIFLAKLDSYLCPIIGGLIGILFLIFYFKMINIDPNKNIVENIKTTFGSILGNIINIILGIFIFSLATLLYYDIINFIGSEYLFNTPSLAIAISVIVPIIYLLNKGLLVIGKTSSILFFLSIVFYLLSVLGLTFQGKMTNLLPFLENGVMPVVHGTLSYIAYSILPIFLLTIIPKKDINIKKGYEKRIIIFYLIVTIINFSVLFNVISVLGIDLASLYQYPDYHVLRRISIGGFIERIESLLAVQWIFCTFIMLVICFYYINQTLKQVFKFNKEKIINFSIPVISMILSLFIFKNNTIANEFTTYIYPLFLFIFLLGIPVILYIFIYRN